MSFIIDIKPSIRTGFVRNKSIPDRVASLWTSAWARPVRAMTLTRLLEVDCSKSRIRLVDSRPSMTGMEISAQTLGYMCLLSSFTTEHEPTHQNNANAGGLCLQDVESFLPIMRDGVVVP